MKFTSEWIAEQRKLLSVDEPERITVSKTIAEQSLDEIERLQAHEEECHKLIDKVLDNCNVGMCTGNSSLVFRLAELVSYYSSLQAENDLLQTNRMCLNRDLAKEQLHAQELQQEKIFFQELSNNWSKRYYKVIDEQRNRIALLEQAKEMMEAEIKESNGLLRSAFMIAKRDGNETNWEAWRKQLEIALARQHKMMYGMVEK